MADNINWDSLPNLKEDHVDLSVTDNAVDSAHIEFSLELSPHLSWTKALIAYDANNNVLGMIRVFDDAKGPYTMVCQLDELDRLELCKAKALGLLTGMYQLRDFAGFAGKRADFYWVKD
jgi:hypothetical protein